MAKWRVHMVESERGWGQDHWYEYFDTKEKADAHLTKINSKNTSNTAPDWYIAALSVEEV